ncbi:MAG TPA: hypothetical protein VF695_02830 [Sphingomonas sp.]|jgi:hypothetical protein
MSDALTGLKNVVLMQERLDVMRREMSELSSDVGKINDRVVDIDRRVARIEGMIEMSRGGGTPPRIGP